ncbi:MAG: M23 family metallopeptidase [Tumebacillaceae bacterium]
MMSQPIFRMLIPLVLTLALLPTSPAAAADLQQVAAPDEGSGLQLPVLHRLEKATKLPWYYLAAVNQYEIGIHWKKNREASTTPASPIRIEIPQEKWSGAINPNMEDSNPLTIKLFSGMGMDGNGDRKADRHDPIDEAYTMAKYLTREGNDEDAIRRCLWDYYQEGIVVDRICGFAHIFQQEGTVDVKGNSFPIPLRFNYTYRSTWGDARGWGGRRSHEGCDIFAGYGTPVLSTAYGVVELKGWNRFGGWRVGIRDLNNVYHYYAHLSGFEKGIHNGSLVKPGQVIGYVGSSGYGKPGTSGKFPPHLHYGMYRDTGTREWAFDPTPHLRKWEREARMQAKKKKKH